MTDLEDDLILASINAMTEIENGRPYKAFAILSMATNGLEDRLS